MNCPTGIASDANGYIIVADRNNNRVLVVDPTLARASQPIVPSGTVPQKPIQSRGRLYVGENGRQSRVLGFSVN